MHTTPFIVAAGQLFAIAFGAPVPRSEAKSARSLAVRSSYKVFGGNGSPDQGWPAQSQWTKFEDLWTANEAMLSKSCAQFGQENNSPEENASIKKAIVSVAGESDIPAEVLFTFMVQESKGCVRAPTTNYGHDNPGLMQSFEGTFSCNKAGTGTVPCPDDTILGMIKEGAGIGRPFGLKQAIEQSGASDVSKYYKGARIYNSGSIDPSGNLGSGIATHCYASDMANRLLGWADSSHSCDEATIGSVSGGSPIADYDPVEKPTKTPTASPIATPTKAPIEFPTVAPVEAPVAAPVDDQEQKEEPKKEEPKKEEPKKEEPKKETKPQPQPTVTPTTGESEPSAPKAEGVATNCSKWYTVKENDTCESTGISFSKLRELNTSLDAKCSNLWLGYAYCIGA